MNVENNKSVLVILALIPLGALLASSPSYGQLCEAVRQAESGVDEMIGTLQGAWMVCRSDGDACTSRMTDKAWEKVATATCLGVGAANEERIEAGDAICSTQMQAKYAVARHLARRVGELANKDLSKACL